MTRDEEIDELRKSMIQLINIVKKHENWIHGSEVMMKELKMEALRMIVRNSSESSPS